MTFDIATYSTVADAFAERVAAGPDRAALTIYRGPDPADHDSITFAELARRAGVRAAGLAARLAPGGRVLIALPTCTEFVECYLACLLAGLVAVPAPVPGGSTNATERVAAIAEDCAPGLAVTTGRDRAALAARLDRLDIPVEEVGPAGPGEPMALPSAYRPGQDTLAVLQYSSGSTGSPKGVMLANRDILADIATFSTDYDIGPDDSFGNWIPLHHDMGLFVQLTAALLAGAHSVLMPPADFVRRPIEWFRLMTRYGTTMTAAPNFAYDLCLRLIRDDQLDGIDLSALRLALNGSEPIHVPIMTEFSKRFACTGLRPDAVSPGYGLAEATVYVTAKPGGVPPAVLVVDPHRLRSAEHPELRPSAGGEGKEVVSVGFPTGLELRIVDPATAMPLPDNAIGEVWLRGPAIGRGYWGKPELSAEIFDARPVGDAGPGWLRTGDLGALVDGRLFITGRLKEMLIVRGRNLFPQDLEVAARAAHEALTGFLGAAFGVPVPDERIVLVHEVNPQVAAEQLPSIAAAVKRRLTVEIGVPVHNIVLVRRGTVRRTTSGKIQRGIMRSRFLAGEIEPSYAELDAAVQAAMALP